MTDVTVLDGGMGRELHRIGAPFRQPEWSALALMTAPEKVLEAHENFIAAGADVVTTNAYALVPFHIGGDEFERNGAGLARSAAQIARRAASNAGRPVIVAGSIPPALGSYKPEAFNPREAGPILDVLIENQRDDVDLWLIETVASIAEAAFVRDKVSDSGKPIWISFTLADRASLTERSALRSGEPVEEAVKAMIDDGPVDALLFNCSQPEEMEEAISIARDVAKASGVSIPLGAYANAFSKIASDHKANEEVSGLREELTPERYLKFSRDWVRAGASLVGGCCGIGPEHIRFLNDAFRDI